MPTNLGVVSGRRSRGAAALLTFLTVLTSLGLLPAAAYADQCAWTARGPAESALAKVHTGDELLKYCEPCGNDKPTPVTVRSVKVQAVKEDPSYFELAINGVGEDTAYLFAKSVGDHWYNLGLAAGCGATQVSQSIRWTPKSGMVR